MARRCLDPIVECHIGNEFRQIVVTIEPAPTPWTGLKSIANAVLFDQVTLRPDRAVAHGCEGAFDGVGNQYEISRWQRSAVMLYIVAYGAAIGTEPPEARRAGRPIHTMNRGLELVAGHLCDSPACAESTTNGSRAQ